MDHFYSLLKFFSEQFIIILGGEPVSHFYILDRMLRKFTAASVVITKGIDELDGKKGHDKVQFRIVTSAFAGCIQTILQKSHPEVLPYYSCCLACRHKEILWTGPNVQIISQSDAITSLIPLCQKGTFLCTKFIPKTWTPTCPLVGRTPKLRLGNDMGAV